MSKENHLYPWQAGPIKGACAQPALGVAHGLNYTKSQFKFESIIPFCSELIILSLAGIGTGSKPPC